MIRSQGRRCGSSKLPPLNLLYRPYSPIAVQCLSAFFKGSLAWARTSFTHLASVACGVCDDDSSLITSFGDEALVQ